MDIISVLIFLCFVVVAVFAYVVIIVVHAAVRIVEKEHEATQALTEEDDDEFFRRTEFMRYLIDSLSATLQERNRIIIWDELSDIIEYVKTFDMEADGFGPLGESLVSLYIQSIEQRELSDEDKSREGDVGVETVALLRILLEEKNPTEHIATLEAEHRSK